MAIISIIIPVYNVESYLAQCLDSIIGQTFKDIEVICVNDGSKDNSLSILKAYAQRDNRIIIIDKQNEGVSVARNVGLDRAHGDYVMFVDSDDWIDAKTCEVTFAAAEKHNADSVMFSYTKVFDGHSITNHLFPEKSLVLKGDALIPYFYRKLIGPIGRELSHPQNMDIYASPCMQLFRRSLIDESRFVDIRKIGTAEDLLFQLDIYKRCRCFVYIDKPYYYYRRTDNGTLTTSYKPDKAEKWSNLFEYISDIGGVEGNKEYSAALKNRIAISSLGLGLNEVASADTILAKAKRFGRILMSPPYNRALAQLNLNCMPIHWRTFYWICKHNHTLIAMLMLECIEYLRKHKR